ncbi:uncharacterized protein LOC131663967 [Phymastichus coffea]|uniref:uncharacterized protein LOC131663967 n=1 Tax=Phymastichus coffea TaxID=108790 RepID=UPI00273AF3F9|nr:uncharacterized protein LOC131663967 [Phymastichus coffea]
MMESMRFNDFERNHRIINVNIDLVGIVAKIGELRYTNKIGCNSDDKCESLPIRDLYIYDDSFTMIRLLLRNEHAENGTDIEVNDVISLKNVKIMKVQNRLVVITLPETIMELNTPEYEALRLKQWFIHNRRDMCKQFMQFVNLSMAPGNLKRDIEIDINTLTQVECRPSKMLRLSRSSSRSEERDLALAPSPYPSADANYDVINDDDISSPRSPENNQVTSDDEYDMERNIKKEKEQTNGKLTIQTEETDDVTILIPNKFDNDKRDIRYKTYSMLMHSPLLEDNWDEEKDQYLVNFITKNSYNLLNDSLYSNLIAEMPDIFSKTTPTILKERVYILSSVKNFLYLLKLCGGDHLTTEKEKSIFLVKVDKLRESMKLIKVSIGSPNNHSVVGSI